MSKLAQKNASVKNDDPSVRDDFADLVTVLHFVITDAL